MNRIRLGIDLETTGQPARPALGLVGRLGVRGVQIDAAGDFTPQALSATGRREFRTLLKSYDLELAALHAPLRRGLDAAEFQQERIDHLQQVMQLSFELGAKKLVVPLPKLPKDAAAPKAVVLRETLDAIGRFGDKCGTIVCLEGGLDSAAAVRDYLHTFEVGSLRACYDPANWLANGFEPLAELTPFQGILAFCHARDARKSSLAGGAQEVPVGAGDVDWLGLLGTLAALEYGGFLVVERREGADRFADAKAGVEFLQKFVPPG